MSLNTIAAGFSEEPTCLQLQPIVNSRITETLQASKPWRDINKLKDNHDTYTESFIANLENLEQAEKYHEKCTELRKGIDSMNEKIDKHLQNITESKSSQLKSAINNNSNGDVQKLDQSVEYSQIINNDGKDVIDIALSNLISALNEDQLRVFEKVKHTLQSKDSILRLYVSGAGGTGKSFLIDVIKHWIKNEMKKKVLVTAPTGIAAFNVNGIMIYKAFQLPVEHGHAFQYYQLSDNALKVLRIELTDIVLVIIDEISMVSNFVLLYIHLRLMEIFNTINEADGWFGKIHILVFGDLLQLPPVREDPAFIDLSSKSVEKLLGSLGNYNLWKNLFSYDKLIINMRQKTDLEHSDLLARLRVAGTTSDDIKVLEQQKTVIHHSNLNFDDRIKQLSNYITNLPDDTVCLLPTCRQCDILHSTMLENILTKELILLENDDTRTAGLAKIIRVKIGAKIMIQRNIDVSIGLVNGTIGTIDLYLKQNF
ncbi:ATP-dependent DNA helicase PIF1-like [Chelonus insularis]|uniref:ATP-dependent DNA helicase PIF1-like n=1 Tax=Chelonus insularis TaxID=460826 RepID=UPI00158CE356|nr:ATP-dependent DNA helicase PIF1-like [Chelonus insularis]